MGGFAKATVSGGAAATDHGLLTGLGDDDHPQYQRSVDVREGAVSVVKNREIILNYDAGDFVITDEGGGSAGIALATTPIAGMDIQENGASVVPAATALNFDENDFTVTDEGGGVAGIALDATLFAGVYLAIDGSNRMQDDAEIRTLYGVLDFETLVDESYVSEEFLGSAIDESKWALTKEWADAYVTATVASGLWEIECVQATDTTDNWIMVQSNWTIQGDFEVVCRVTNVHVDNQCPFSMLRLADPTDWPDGQHAVDNTDQAQISLRRLGTPVHTRTINGNITGTTQSAVNPASEAVWFRIVRSGTTVTSYYNDTDGGSDTTPGSWTTFQTKAAAGLNDELRVGLIARPGATDICPVGTFIRFYNMRVISADTINGSGTRSSGWVMDIDDALLSGSSALKLTHAGGSTTKTLMDFIHNSDGAEIRLYDDAGTTWGSLLNDGSNLVLSTGGATPANIIFMTEGQYSEGTVSSTNTGRLQLGGSLTRGNLFLTYRETATVQNPFISIVDTDDQLINLGPNNDYRIGVWEDTDPDDGSDPVGHLCVMKYQSGSDWTTGELKAGIDIGMRTDGPEDMLFFNNGAALKKIGFGACAAFACIYNSGTDLGQTVTAGAPELFTQFSTNYTYDRSATADRANSKITTDDVGIYLVIFSASGTSDTNNTLVNLEGRVDGVIQGQLHAERKIGTAGDYGNMGFCGIVNIAAGPKDVDVYVTADQNCELTFDECSLTVIQIG